MSWSPLYRRFWWLLPLTSAVLGILVLVGVSKRSLSPPPASHVRPQPSVRPRVRGLVSSALGSEEHITAVGDFNGDGHQDLALTNGDPDSGRGINSDPQGAVTLWLGDGHGGLRHGPVLQDIEATLLATLDADGDGDDDLLAGSCCDDSLVLWRNEGRGRLAPQFIASSWGIDDLATGDLDGDGDPDIVIPYGHQLQVGLNDGRGHFRWRTQEMRPGPGPVASNDLFERVALADVDGDHDLDIVSPRNLGSILFNDGKGQFGHEQRLYGCTGYSLAIGDLNGDARPDLVMDLGGGQLGVYLNDRTGHFGAASLSQTLTHSWASESNWVALGDVDRDGDLDLVFNSYQGEVWVQLNTGPAQFEPAYHIPATYTGMQELSLADLDRDGWLDVLEPIPAASARRGQPLRASLVSLRPPTGTEYYYEVDQLPTAVGGGAVLPVVEAAMQKRLVVPPGYNLDLESTPYTVEFIVGQDGTVQHLELGWRKITPSVDSAMANTLRHLRFAPGRLHGRPVRVALHLSPRLSGQGPPQTFPPLPGPGQDSVYTHVEHPPTFANGQAILPLLREEGLNQLILPDSEQLPPHSRMVVGLLVEKDGDVQGYRPLESISQRVDAALTGGLGNLQRLAPGRHRGRPVRVALRLVIEPTGADAPLRQSAAERLEAQTRKQGLALRRPGETDAQFVRRVLPLSLAYNGHLLAYAWRPGAFGKQLFVTTRGQGNNEYGTDLLVLDPYRPNTYALRILTLGSMGDLTNLEALFFADIDHDGRPELLALKECSLRETLSTDKHGQRFTGHASHYGTDIFRLAGPDRTGRPRYQPDTTTRPYLDELATAAAVRQALARHQAGGHRPR